MASGSGKTEPRRKLTGRAGVLMALTLLVLPACFAKKDFTKAEQQDTPAAYEKFLKKYPDTKGYSKEAKARLEALRFQEACKTDTYAAYMQFLTAYPAGVGRLSRQAEMKAEDIRCRELDIRLYRSLPSDYHAVVSTRHLPYRLMVRSLDPEGSTFGEIESNWYFELKRKDLFVPMDPQRTYPVNPDLVLYVNQSVIYLCYYPMSFVQAQMWAGEKKLKEYRVAAVERADKILLYEIFKDREFYDSLLAIPAKEKKAVSERFNRLLKRLPLPGSVAFEVDIRQDAYPWDRDMTLDFAEFLNDLNLYENFTAYPRSQPPDQDKRKLIYFRMDHEIHSPYVRKQWSMMGPTLSWDKWNSKWILAEKDYFFKKMTLDILEFITPRTPSGPPRKGREDHAIVVW